MSAAEVHAAMRREARAGRNALAPLVLQVLRGWAARQSFSAGRAVGSACAGSSAGARLMAQGVGQARPAATFSALTA